MDNDSAVIVARVPPHVRLDLVKQHVESGIAIHMNMDLVVEIPKKDVPAGMNLQIGMKLEVEDTDGNPIPVKVKKIAKDKVTMDANHPYAGKVLNFDIEIVNIST